MTNTEKKNLIFKYIFSFRYFNVVYWFVLRLSNLSLLKPIWGRSVYLYTQSEAIKFCEIM